MIALTLYDICIRYFSVLGIHPVGEHLTRRLAALTHKIRSSLKLFVRLPIGCVSLTPIIDPDLTLHLFDRMDPDAYEFPKDHKTVPQTRNLSMTYPNAPPTELGEHPRNQNQPNLLSICIAFYLLKKGRPICKDILITGCLDDTQSNTASHNDNFVTTITWSSH